MISNYKIPGFLLVSLGGLFLSTGGALFKLFENKDVWTIYFWRSFFFTPAVLLFLFFTSKNQVIKKFKSLGLIGMLLPLLGFDAHPRPEAWGWRFGISISPMIICLQTDLTSNILLGISLALLISISSPLVLEKGSRKAV